MNDDNNDDNRDDYYSNNNNGNKDDNDIYDYPGNKCSNHSPHKDGGILGFGFNSWLTSYVSCMPL